jgi:hypothetical protein
MNIEYVMDTSAVRGLSDRQVEAAAKRWRLTVSPLSVYELLCHLDQSAKGHDSAEAAFRFRKDQVLKCRHLEIRDDPFAEQAIAAGARASVNMTRFEDRVVVPQIFPLLETAASPEELRGMTVAYPNGRRGSLHEVATRASASLGKAEEEYASFVQLVRDQLVREYGFEKALVLDGLDYVKYISGSARRLENQYREDGVRIEGGSVFSAIFLHVGYILARTRLYMSRVGDGEPLRVDRNDMEDAAILLHLDLREPCALVTNDGSGKKPGTIHAFNEALSHLKTASELLGAEVVALPRVLALEEFRAMLAST